MDAGVSDDAVDGVPLGGVFDPQATAKAASRPARSKLFIMRGGYPRC